MFNFEREFVNMNRKDRRKCLISVSVSYDDSYKIVSTNTSISDNFSLLIEGEEIFNDKKYSKIKIIKIFKKDNRKLPSTFINWIESSKIYWLEPSINISRDKKISTVFPDTSV